MHKEHFMTTKSNFITSAQEKRAFHYTFAYLKNNNHEPRT